MADTPTNTLDIPTDTISRQAAIDALNMDISIIPFAKAREYVRAAIDEIYNRLKELLSAQQWIPTSVRPPKDFDTVYIQTKWGTHEICKYIPKKVKPKEYPDGFWGDADYPKYDYFDVDAWMPLPEPWEGGEA